jgi:hypothetical protein
VRLLQIGGGRTASPPTLLDILLMKVALGGVCSGGGDERPGMGEARPAAGRRREYTKSCLPGTGPPQTEGVGAEPYGVGASRSPSGDAGAKGGVATRGKLSQRPPHTAPGKGGSTEAPRPARSRPSITSG